MKKIIGIFSIITLFFVASCGTLLKPDQRNKPHSGQLDWTVFALDTLGLLFFFLPGAIAFAVDYSNGTLFLPRKNKRVELKDTSVESIQQALAENGYEVTKEQIEKALQA